MVDGIARSGWASKWIKRRSFDGNIFFLQHARRNGMTSQWSSEKKEKKDSIFLKHSHQVIVLQIKQSPWSSVSEEAEILKSFWEAGYAPTMQQLIGFWFILNLSQKFVPIFIMKSPFAHLNLIWNNTRSTSPRLLLTSYPVLSSSAIVPSCSKSRCIMKMILWSGRICLLKIWQITDYRENPV